jgi:ribosomal protein L16 Arg81 hydroxylase
MDLSLREFMASYFGRRALARAGSARPALEACDWQGLGQMLASKRSPDALVVTRGALTADPIPRSLPALRALFARSVGIVVRNADRQHPPLARMSRTIAEQIPGTQRILVFATPAGTHGFGWHYDAEDVFIVQTAGEKAYYFRENTVDPRPVLGAQPDFSTIGRETTPLMCCVLAPGDVLYLPRGYWHVAQPLSDSLSISIGIYQE